jgi:diguanylate cyclase (GGDEF)-like protein/PAS domain S-box-containing protein
MIKKKYAPRWLRHSAGLLGLMALLTLLYLRAEMVSPQAHYRYLENLRSLQQADVQINSAVLATHAELAHNYDDLVSHLQRARTTLRIAADSPAFLSDEARAALRDKTSELNKSFDQKTLLIDHYQRSNSIFRNSVDYFPRASASFLDSTNPQRRLAYYGPFVREMLTLSRTPSPELVSSLKQQLQRFNTLQLPASERSALEHLLPHARTILQRHPEIDALVRHIINAETTLQLEELTRLYTAGHEDALRIAGYYRLLLFAAGLLLVIYVVYAYARIERNQRELASANKELLKRFEALRHSEYQTRLYGTVFTNAAEGMTITDGHSRIVAVNPAFCAITGYSAPEVIGKNPALLNSGRQNAAFYEEMWKALKEQGKWNGEIWNRRKDGATYPEWLSISAVRNEAGETIHFIGIFTDITDRKQAEERIQHLAHHDALTGLPNRLLLEDRVTQAVLKSKRSGKSTAILFLDLDRFKNINDTLGHEVGDGLLIEAAERGKAVLRETDTLARLGGDEFVVVLPEIDSAQDAGQVARKLLQGLSLPYNLAGHNLTVTGSIGIALCPDDGCTASELLRNADTAMYRAKDEGRNLFRFYSADMNFATLGELLLESHLRSALKNGELLLHYQPKYDALTGKMVAAEALMRWQHPEHGLIPPVRFIPLAEECGLISALGEWALYAACQQQRQWLDAGLAAVPVAVNVSAQQFTHQNIPALVASALSENNLPPALLELELTESLLVRNASETTAVLTQLRAMQINMAIDDFGTGYSSLTYLKHFPVQALKVDRAFVQDIDASDDQVKLAPAIIALAHSLGMYVIAEGIETEAQRDFLSMHECDQFQGYLFARPMPAAAFSQHLATQR